MLLCILYMYTRSSGCNSVYRFPSNVIQTFLSDIFMISQLARGGLQQSLPPFRFGGERCFPKSFDRFQGFIPSRINLREDSPFCLKKYGREKHPFYLEETYHRISRRIVSPKQLNRQTDRRTKCRTRFSRSIVVGVISKCEFHPHAAGYTPMVGANPTTVVQLDCHQFYLLAMSVSTEERGNQSSDSIVKQ